MSKKKNAAQPGEALSDRYLTCGEIGTGASATHKYGHDEDDTCLPAAAQEIKWIQTIEDRGSRKKILKQCPTCNDYFLYELELRILHGRERELRRPDTTVGQ